MTLIALMLVVPIIRFLTLHIDDNSAETMPIGQEGDCEKATAAVVAVGTLLARDSLEN